MQLSKLLKIGEMSKYWRKFAEFMAVSFLAAMFSAFLLQIFMRYVMNNPLGWTLEACVILYIWTVFWTSAFVLKESDHITFTVISDHVRPGVKRVMLVIGHIIIGIAFVSALPAVVDYVTFMKIESTPIAHLRFDFVFSIFVVFLGAVAFRSIINVYRDFRAGDGSISTKGNEK